MDYEQFRYHLHDLKIQEKQGEGMKHILDALQALVEVLEHLESRIKALEEKEHTGGIFDA